KGAEPASLIPPRIQTPEKTQTSPAQPKTKGERRNSVLPQNSVTT
ncbi:MAG: hypothetical protein ACI8UO_003630, partial [Verrucomicrobiales bacterium]